MQKNQHMFFSVRKDCVSTFDFNGKTISPNFTVPDGGGGVKSTALATNAEGVLNKTAIDQ